MKQVRNWIVKAQHSKMALLLLNLLFWKLVPFNRPHGIRIESLDQAGTTVRMPFRRRNCNHLGGLHACGLATIAEFAAGVSLLQFVDPAKYRLIMRTIEMEYVAQARSAVSARAEVTDSILLQLRETLVTERAVDIAMGVHVVDIAGKDICSARVCWQLKDWRDVRTPASATECDKT